MDAVTLASIEASILTTLFTQPIWVIKTRMLLNVNKKISELQNFKKQTSEIYRQHGFNGFLKGLQLSLVLSFSGVVQMYVYEGAKLLYDRLNIPVSPLDEKHFVCGSLSKIFSVLLSYPITTMRTRIQQNQFVGSEKKQKYSGVGELFMRTARDEGLRGFYKGISANLMRGVGQKGIYFYFYEIFKSLLFPSH
jgi:solute carrier family 25 folate transporter 32